MGSSVFLFNRDNKKYHFLSLSHQQILETNSLRLQISRCGHLLHNYIYFPKSKPTFRNQEGKYQYTVPAFAIIESNLQPSVTNVH